VTAWCRYDSQEKDYYNQKARALPGSADFFFVSYAWEPPSQSDPRRGARPQGAAEPKLSFEL
jgi:hypothetical protein